MDKEEIQISFVSYQNGDWEFIMQTSEGDVVLRKDAPVTEEDQELLFKYAPACVYTTYFAYKT